MLSGKSFLVTGATGRIGADLVPRLEQLGARVVPLVLGGYPRSPRRVPWTADAQPLSMFRPRDLQELPRIDYAIHLHWGVNRALSFSDQVAAEVSGNILDPSFLWEWIKDQEVKKFVNCSSIRVYSHLNRNPVSSRTEPKPLSPYGVAKLLGEKYLTALLHGGPTVVSHLRLGSICSFGENPTQLTSRLVASVLENLRITVNTGRRVSLMYIDDAVDLIINTALTGEDRIYLAAAPAVTTDKVAEIFQGVSGITIHADYADLDSGVQDLEFDSDLDLLRAPWMRQTPLEKALLEILDRSREDPGTS